MKPDKIQELEARRVHDLYWESYLRGDVETAASILDEDVTAIWTAESEVFNNKAELVSCIQDTRGQIAGKAEFRNRDVRCTTVEGLFQFSEFADVYVLNDATWSFYSKIRLSTLMRNVKGAWKVVQQHCSLPDPRVQEGETLAPDAIQRENFHLRDAIKRRTHELESKNRELAVEACLERVRTHAMAMRRAEDLVGVSEALFVELRSLGFDELRNTMINIHDDEKGSFHNHDYSDVIGPSVTRLSYATHPVIEKQFRQIRSSRDAFSEAVYTGKELEEWKQFRKERGEKDDPRIESTTSLHYYFYSIETGSIGVSTFSPIGEIKLALLKRFRNVFDFAYRKYLDVVQAEQRAKEAQMEAALERVRAVAMSMRKPADMVEVCHVISDQLRTLDVANVRNVQTAIFRDDTGTYLNYEYFTQYGTVSISEVVTKLHPTVMEFAREIRSAQDAFYSTSFSGERLKEWTQYRKETNQNEDPILERAESVHYYFYSVGPGALGVSTYAPLSDEELEVFRRFRNVFDLAYRRFIDIEQAEAQAREAQIEAALERVRSRTLAMQRSDELTETSFVLFEQLKHLGEVGEQVSIGIFDKEDGTMELYATIYGHRWQHATRCSYTEHDVLTGMHRAWMNHERSMVTDLSGEPLKSYNAWRTQFTDVGQTAGLTYSNDRWIIHSAFFSRGLLSFSTKEPRPKETLDLLERFAGVFDLTYTRFLDLKQAEAQAREATIEAALERVRSKAMAMRDSSDLSATSGLVFTEMRKLGISSVRCGVVLLTRGSQVASLYFTSHSVESDLLSHAGTIELAGHPSLEKQYDQWMKREDYLVTLKNQELLDYYDCIHKQNPVTFIPKAQEEQEEHGYYLYFSEGQFYVWTQEPYSEEQLAILQRFKAIIDLTFRRYLELQRAEAQAYQAQLDLIQLQNEKKRAEEALSELRAMQVQLLQQEKLASLGQLTAGIAHEIKNPLNFVNNFSSVSMELLDEVTQEIQAAAPDSKTGEIRQLLSDIRTNLSKIVQHGTRADGIVKSMLQHSRGGSGRKEPIDLNTLIKEFANLAFHGMRAGKNPINVDIVLELQDPLSKVNAVAEDFSRVIINLCQNAFDAMRDKLNSQTSAPGPAYLPTLTLRTRREANRVMVEIADNGPGIPDAIKDKILQPFFTTKKGSQGTGLGLSITHDIVKAHGGEMTIQANPQGGATFVIALPAEA